MAIAVRQRALEHAGELFYRLSSSFLQRISTKPANVYHGASARLKDPVTVFSGQDAVANTTHFALVATSCPLDLGLAYHPSVFLSMLASFWLISLYVYLV